MSLLSDFYRNFLGILVPMEFSHYILITSFQTFSFFSISSSKEPKFCAEISANRTQSSQPASGNQLNGFFLLAFSKATFP